MHEKKIVFLHLRDLLIHTFGIEYIDGYRCFFNLLRFNGLGKIRVARMLRSSNIYEAFFLDLLFHIAVDDDYELEGLDLASHYVGLRLLEKYHIELIEDLARFCGGDQGAICGHLFGMYGNRKSRFLEGRS